VIGLQVTGDFDGRIVLAVYNFSSSFVIQEKVNTLTVLQLDQANWKFR
jgi:hypothetical protein